MGETLQIRIDGMSCAACVGRVERALARVPGVQSAAVNLVTGRATVRGPSGLLPAPLVAAIAAAGYGAAAVGVADPGAATQAGDPSRGAGRAAAVAAAATLPLAAIEMAGHLHPALHHRLGMLGWPWIAAVLATFVLFGPGARFFRAGIPALWRAAPDMNALIVLGTGAAWGYSVAALLWPGALAPAGSGAYFEAAAVIVTLVLAGRWGEARAKGRAGAAIARLAALQSATARVLRGDREVEVPRAAVVPGDIVAIRPGERLPVDGTVLEGESHLDTALLTGEPLPRACAPGDRVTGGTLNLEGAFRYRAERVGAETVLAGILRMVEDAQGGKLPIQRLVDRVTGVFVPIVMVVAAVTLAVWLIAGAGIAVALTHAVAVLIIACPCAMGLATPVSILAASGRGAELGILFRRGEAIEALAGVTHVAFDKTGTLTEGRPALAALTPAQGVDGAEVLRLAASLEQRSEHPLARALVAAAEGALSSPATFAALPGRGVTGEVDGRRIDIGAAAHMAGLGHDISPFAAAAEGGLSPVYIAVDGQLSALVTLRDPVRPGAGAAVAALVAQGISVSIVTGDDRGAAATVARLVGIDPGSVTAETLPGDKQAAVAALTAGGARVAFVGDGINDAPALAAADVGIAMGGGSDIAAEAADAVLTASDPGRVALAIGLSRATIANIRQNLAFAFGYNVVLIPVAAGVLTPGFGITLSPMLAAGAMALSSLSVLANALRLRRFGRGA